MLWNANGLLKHKDELLLVLSKEKIDICLISETHFTNENKITIPEYSIYHTAHPLNTARGGSAVIIKSIIEHYEENKYCSIEFQATTVSVKTTHGMISISAVYSPPRNSIQTEIYKSLIQYPKHKFIMGGDFNAKHTYWGSRLINTKGRRLLQAAKQHGCEFLSTGKPTYWPTDSSKTPDLIDFFILNKISKNFLKIYDGYDFNSDHTPIFVTFTESVSYKKQEPSLSNKHTDWEYFKALINNDLVIPTNICSTDELDEIALNFVKIIQNASWNSTPAINKKQIGYNYPNEIKDMLIEKRKLRRKWQQTRNPADKTLFNRASQQLKRKIKDFQNQKIQQHVMSLSADKNNDYSLWRATKSGKVPPKVYHPIKNSNGQWSRSHMEKAQVFSEYLENIFSLNNIQTPLRFDIQYDITDYIVPEITETEIQNEIINLSDKKAAGYDLITAEILKQLPRKGIIVLTKIIHSIFELEHIPTYWKVAEVLMIPKPGKPPTDVTSYRPISLLPTLSKLFEKVFIKRLKPIIEEKQIIPTHQFGFREKHSTIDQIHRITEVIENTFEEKKVCSAVFLDVAKAFDKVWHDGLLYKISTFMPHNYCKLLESYLKNRYFRIKYEGEYSDLKEIKAGVPQGSILGPMLYLIFTYDLPNPPNTTIATFADDTAVLAVGSTEEEAAEYLQPAINSIYEWANLWQIELNHTKSVHVTFKNSKAKSIPITINGNKIPYENHAKYLGMTLDVKLKWNEHVKKKKQELEIKYRSLDWLIGRRSSLSIQNKIAVYNQIIKPIWTYGIQLWGCAKPSVVNIIQRFQNKVIRKIVNAPWYLRNSDIHRDLRVDTVKTVIQKYAAKHQTRLSSHVNQEARNLYNTEDQPRRLQRTKPQDLVRL